MRPISNSILCLALFLQLIISVIIFDTSYVTQFPWISDLYRLVGFKWPEIGGQVFSTLLLTAMASYTTAIAIIAIKTGWPSYAAHDRSTLRYSLTRLAIFSISVFIAVGLFGYKANNNSGYEPLEFIGLSLASIIFAGIVIIFDDALGAVYISLRSER